MRLEALLHGHSAEQFVVRGQRSGIGRRRRSRSPKHAPQNPIAPLHRACAQRSRRRRKHGAQSKSAAPTVLARMRNQFHRARRLHVRRNAVVLCQRLVQKRVISGQNLPHRLVVPDDLLHLENRDAGSRGLLDHIGDRQLRLIEQCVILGGAGDVLQVVKRFRFRSPVRSRRVRSGWL